MKIITLIIIAILSFVQVASAEETNINRQQSIKMLVSMIREHQRYEVTTAPFSDTDDDDVSYAKALNLVYGEDNCFNPDGVFTHQDFLLVMKRAIDRAAPDIFYDNTKIKSYKNAETVKDYAKYSLDYLTIINILREYDEFDPNSKVTQNDVNLYIERAQYVIQYASKCQLGKMPENNYPKVLLYHHVASTENVLPEYVDLFVSPENFEQQIKYLSENGYTFLFPEEISYADWVEKSVVITFDDGAADNFYQALPILEKYNAKATLYVCTDMIDTPGYCSREQLVKMNTIGVFRIHSHTKSHPKLTDLSENDLIQEFATSNDLIYNITLRDVNSIAYPFGIYNDFTLRQAQCYYRTGFSTFRYDPKNIHAIKRESIVYDCTLQQFEEIMLEN